MVPAFLYVLIFYTGKDLKVTHEMEIILKVTFFIRFENLTYMAHVKFLYK